MEHTSLDESRGNRCCSWKGHDLALKTICELYVLIAMVALPFAGMISYGVYDGAQRDFDNATSRAQQLADFIAARVERFLPDFRVRPEAVARRPPVQSMDPVR